MIVGGSLFPMATACFGNATLMVTDSVTLLLATVVSNSLGKTDTADRHINYPVDLFERQTLGVGDHLTSAKLMTNTSAKQLADHRQNHVAIGAEPSAALANGPVITTGNSIAIKVPHLAGAKVLGNDHCALRTDHSAIVSLAIDSLPANFPDLGTPMRIPDLVTLRYLRRQVGRVFSQVLHLASLPVPSSETRTIPFPSLGLLLRFSQHFGRPHPCMKVG